MSPSLDGMDDLEMTREALVSRIEELQVERESVAESLDEDGSMAGFELTETAFFG